MGKFTRVLSHSDFSLVEGGPLHHLWWRTHLTGPHCILRRIIALTLLMWMPLLLLSIWEGHAWVGSVELPFLYDVEMHLRLLVAMPILIVAEPLVHHQMNPLVDQFLARKLIPGNERKKFDAAIASATRLRNSVTAEVLLLLFVYAIGIAVVWRAQVNLGVSSWHSYVVNEALYRSWSGWWLGFVSLPLFQFLLLRWYFRFFIWARFLWQVSRIELHVIPTHPDRCGGLGFLSLGCIVFSPLLFAQGVLLAGMMSNRIFYGGAQLFEFKWELASVVGLNVIVILGPMLVFSPRLAEVRRVGLREYGVLAQQYVHEFDRKWLRGGAGPDEPLLATGDLQSLADLGTSYEGISDMKLAPFSPYTVLQLALAIVVPVLPLLLTMFPLAQLLEGALKIIF